MVKIICLVAFLNFMLCSRLFGQNLILNHSFEQFSSTAWKSVLTVDYLNPGPNQEGNVTVTDGTTCVGLRFWSPIADDWQEYIAQIVAGKFEAGKTYKISFYYKLADRCVFSTDDLGVGFIHDWLGNPAILDGFIDQIDASLKNPENDILTNYNQYQQFSQYYTATGTETYLVIGCFKKDANLTYEPISNPTTNPMPDIYFLIDEVEVFACPTMPESLLENSHISCNQLPVELSTNISADSYLWSNGSVASSTQALSDEDLVWLEATFGECKMRDTISIQRFSGPSDLGSDILLCGTDDFPVELKVNALPNETISWSTDQIGSRLLIYAPGNYSVTKSLGTCTWTDEINVLDLFEEIVLYPNPSSDEIHFKNENSISILNVTTEDGKKLILSPITVQELNQLIKELKPAIYILDVELNSCFKRLKMCLIN
jgi:hypothetical protein